MNITKTLAACALAAMVVGCTQKTSLYVYTWADYIDPDLIDAFEKENGCKVVIDTFDSNETMFAKIMSGATGYDIIMPTDYFMPHLIHADLVERLELGKLPLVERNLDRSFTNSNSLVYNVPYAFSFVGILWRKDKVPSDIAFQDWNDMFDSRFNGHVCMMDDIREVLGLGLKMRGHSVNSVDKKELEEAVEVVKGWKSKCNKMDNEAYRTAIPSGELYAAMAYNSDAVMLLVDSPETIGYAIPTNGVISSMDVFCVMKGSRNKELAYRFIDMFYNPTNAARNAQYNCAPMPVVGMFDALDEEYKKVPFMRITDEMRSKFEAIEDVGGAMDFYNKAWDKVKATTK